MTENENKLGGPRTEEGKQRSSQNAIKHRLFALNFLLPGESQDEYDRHLYRYHKEYNPKQATEEDLVRQLAETEWRRRRIPFLEADSILKSIESGDAERKFMNTYSIYDQRFNRMFLNILKTLNDLQGKRKRETGVHFRLACILYKNNQRDNIPWNPADDGFVFSSELLGQRLNLLDRMAKGVKEGPDFATNDEINAFMAKDVL